MEIPLLRRFPICREAKMGGFKGEKGGGGDFGAFTSFVYREGEEGLKLTNTEGRRYT